MSEEEKAELEELYENSEWWHNRFKAVQRDYENLQQRIDKTTELIKDRIEYIEMEELSWVEMPYEDYKEEYKELLETLEGKE